MPYNNDYSGAGGGGGGSYGTCWSASTYMPTCSGYNGNPFPKPTKEEIKRAKERDKAMERMAKEAKKRLEKRTLADLSDESKEIIMNHAHQLLREYKIESEVKSMLKGLSIFLALIGLAVFFNFSTILKIVQGVVSCAK